MRLLTPTDNRRLNELVGFLGVILAVLFGLSLISYHPADVSFNVSTPGAVQSTSNWIGPAGAHAADLLFQGFGFAAFLLPVALGMLGVRWFRSQMMEAPVAKICGFTLLVLTVTALFQLMHFPEVRSAAPAGGLVGVLVADGMRAILGGVGGFLVTAALFFVALFLTTTFSFSSAAQRLSGPVSIFGGIHARYAAWKKVREERANRLRVERMRNAGRPPAPAQARNGALKSAVVENEELEDEESPAGRTGPVLVREAPPDPLAPKRNPVPEPKIARGKTGYRLPSPGLLRTAERAGKIDEDELKDSARIIEEKTAEFGVAGHVTQINPGPVVTTFEFKPEAGIKYSRITSLGEDLCLALRAESILIERIPGKSTVGIEVPNHHRQTIALREAIESPEFINSHSRLTLSMGKDLHGRIRTTDLAQMPHLLIAGATGTGKSVFLNSLIMSMLYKATPDELRLVLVDPKRLELGLYEDIPHLLAPVVNDPKVASNVLRNATGEMERRLKLLAQRGVRNIEQYNRAFQKGESMSLFDSLDDDEQRPLPYIVIIIDELADLMMVDTNNVEAAICRLAQMARAVGIHLILATQRPSVDVITGLIKANFAARISFRVASKVDSRTILDANGSESLLGRGDMLYLPAGSARLHRIHGPLVTEDEISGVCDHWRAQAKAAYNQELLKPPLEDLVEQGGRPTARGAAAGASAGSGASGGSGARGGAIANYLNDGPLPGAPNFSGDGGEGELEDEVDDKLYQDAVRVVCEMGRASTSTLQRRLRVGYGRAARLIDLMYKDGIVGPPDGTRPREVLKPPEWLREFDNRDK